MEIKGEGGCVDIPCVGALLHADVEALAAESDEQGARGAHAGEVFGGVDGEEVGHDVRHGRVLRSRSHAHGIDADEGELEPILARVPAAEIREDEKGACRTVLVLGLVRRGNQRAHQSP